MILKKSIQLFLTGAVLLSAASYAYSNVGQITGIVLDEKSGEPVIGASVQVEGTTIGAACDIDGRFIIRNVSEGAHTLIIASVGYTAKRITGIAIKAGEALTIDAGLGEAVTEMPAVEVTGERARATESAMLIKRRNATNVTDGISAEMIKTAGDGNAGEALRRVVGVSVVDGRNLVVRGMGGRYSNVTLNGAPLPSPEPEKREVPLDLFPGTLLDEVTASKTFTPDRPGTFTGGSVDLTTREFPPALSYNVSMSRSYNSVTTGADMMSYPGGDLDWLAFDDGTRDLPTGLRDEDWGVGTNPAKNESLAEALENRWTPVTRKAPWNSSVGANVGNTYMIGENSKFGVMASLSYSNSYRARNEIYREWSEISASHDFKIQRGTQSVLWGSVLNLTLSSSENHKLAFKGLYNRSAEDEARIATGWFENEGSNILDTRLRFSQKFITSGQLSGEHQVSFPVKSVMAWRLQLAGAGYDEPDTRSNRFNLSEDENGDTVAGWVNSHYSGVHIYQKLDDDDAQAAYDWTIPFGEQSRVKTGVLFQNRTRYAEALRFRFNNLPTQYPLRVGTGEEIFAPENVGAGRDQYYLESLTFPDDIYDVNEHTLASYTQLEAGLSSRVRLIAGARYEDYDMALNTGSRTEYNARVLVAQKAGDWLPMASLIMGVSDHMNLRGVVSRTVARPEFRELTPFQYQDLAVGRPTIGNPDLKPASITNYDLRWEYYPTPGEVLAVTLFAKKFKNPIEQVVGNTNTSQPINTFVNADAAENYGVEFEARKGLTFLPGALSRLLIGGNLTLISAEVTIAGQERQLEQKRQLQGQSAWSTNLSLIYISANGLTDMTVVYNAFDQRIKAIDLTGRDPWFEQPRHSMDFTAGHKLWSDVGLKLGIKNLLNQAYEVTQVVNYGDFMGQEVLLERYELGRTFSLGISYGL